MPPPRTIHVDRLTILANIRQAAAEQLEAALVRTATYREQERVGVLALAAWVPRDLQRLAGKLLTPSERKRHQEALRAMAAEGLVALDARHVKLLPAGVAALGASHG
jgi:hypothetical protein